MSILHKSLTKNNYFFESVQRKNYVTKFCFLRFKVIVFNAWNLISMINFEKTSTKIYKNQLLKRMTRFQISIASTIVTINFNLINVFFDNSIFESNNHFHERMFADMKTIKKNFNKFFHVNVFRFFKIIHIIGEWQQKKNMKSFFIKSTKKESKNSFSFFSNCWRTSKLNIERQNSKSRL